MYHGLEPYSCDFLVRSSRAGVYQPADGNKTESTWNYGPYDYYRGEEMRLRYQSASSTVTTNNVQSAPSLADRLNPRSSSVPRQPATNLSKASSISVPNLSADNVELASQPHDSVGSKWLFFVDVLPRFVFLCMRQEQRLANSPLWTFFFSTLFLFLCRFLKRWDLFSFLCENLNFSHGYWSGVSNRVLYKWDELLFRYNACGPETSTRETWNVKVRSKSFKSYMERNHKKKSNLFYRPGRQLF